MWARLPLGALSIPVSQMTIRQKVRLERQPLTGRIPVDRSIAIAGGVAAISAAWIWPLPEMARDLFSAHMLQHILVMNVAALLLAIGMIHVPPRQWPTLPAATALQLGALWAWHMPAVFTAAHHHLFLHSLMQVSLLAAALAFWKAVLVSSGQRVWRPIFALLATAKIFCLLGAVFIFSRRTLYPGALGTEVWGLSAVEDQQLAGLLMISSCTLVYVAAAIVIFARWLADLEASEGLARNRGAAIAFIAK